MKISNQLILSFFILLSIVLSINIYFVNTTINKLTEKNIQSTTDNLELLKNANFNLSEEIISDYGERIVMLRAENAALELAISLKGRDLSNLNLLRKDDELRKIATQKMFTGGREIGHIDVYDIYGEIIFHPNESIEGRNYSEWSDVFPDMWELALKSFEQERVSGYYSFIDEDENVRERYVAIIRIPGTDFNISAVVNIDWFFIPVHQQIEMMGSELKKSALISTQLSTEESKAFSLRFLIFLYFLIFALSVVVTIILSKFLVKPILKLRDAVLNMSKNNLDQKVAITGSTETRQLAESFNRLGDQLKDYLEELKTETTARQAIESELNIASQIQKSILPSIFPPFPERKEFDLFAFMKPAKEVGGDFYDFFLKDESTLVMIIADVSGKGVPAALFMMVCRTLLNTLARTHADPAIVLEKANNILCQNNDAGMFVTTFIASFDYKTGSLKYSNGGHSPALIASKNDYRELTTENSTALGFIENLSYKNCETKLLPNDKFFVYTDGVIDACNPEGVFFGEERLINAIVENQQKEPMEIINVILKRLEIYECSNQYDDITMLLMSNNKI